MRYENLPVYGPTEVLGDEDTEAVVVVRVAYALSREQLLTALSIGYTEMVPDRDPDSLTVDETRSEVEGWLAAQSIIELDRYVTQGQLTAYPAEQQAVLDQLAEAVTRAYSPRPVPPVMQSPRYRDGTVTLQTSDHGEVVVNEPAWCVGHGDEYVGRLADLTHNGRHVTATVATEKYGQLEFLDAFISHAPYGELQPEPHPVVSLHLDLDVDVTPDDGMRVARGLRVAAARVDRVVAEAERLRGGGRP